MTSSIETGFRPLSPGRTTEDTSELHEVNTIDDGSNFNTLFDPYLRSPSPYHLPEDSTSELTSEFSGTTMIDGGRNQSCHSTDALETPIAGDMTDGNDAWTSAVR